MPSTYVVSEPATEPRIVVSILLLRAKASRSATTRKYGE
jgi:hypothetical protein